MLCTDCQNNKQTLLRCMESAVNIRENGVDPNTRSMVLIRSMTLQKQSIEYHQNESEKKSKKIAWRDKAIDKLDQSTVINVHMNEHADDIFNDDVVEEVNKFLSQKVSKDSVAQYAFA